MTEWMCMVPSSPPDLICNYESCELRCPYREAREKVEAVKNLCYGKDHIVYWVRREDIGKILEAEG